MNQKHKKFGPKPLRDEVMDRQFPIRWSDKLHETLDDLRRVEKDLPSRSEMMRRLVERAGGDLAKELSETA